MENLKRYTAPQHEIEQDNDSGEFVLYSDVAALETENAELREDKKRIDFMEGLLAKAEYTGQAILRKSTTGRGWRLHETSWPNASDSVRGAIDRAIEETARVLVEELQDK